MRFSAAILGLAASLSLVQAQDFQITAVDFCGRQYTAANQCSYNVICGYRVPRRIDEVYRAPSVGLLKCTDEATAANPAVMCTDFNEETMICQGFDEKICKSTRRKGRFYKMATLASCPDAQ